jgi:hypothetical protein
MSLCLTEDELVQLTGKRQGKGMARWLAKNDFVFKMGGDGLPRVDREHYRQVMSAKRPTVPRGPRLHGLKAA